MSGDKQLAARMRKAREEPRRADGRPAYSREKWAIILRSAAGREAGRLPSVGSLADMIKQWENGAHTPSERYRRLYEKVTGEPLFGESPSAAELLPADDPSVALSTATGRRVGPGIAAEVAARVHRLRLADDVLAGGDLMGPAGRELDGIVRLYRDGSYPERVGRVLLSLVGEAAQIAGWVTSDAGVPGRAAEIYRMGIEAATESGDRVLLSNLVGSLAYQEANAGRPKSAVVLARQAVDAASHDGPPQARALAWDRLAWAHARAGETHDAIRALGRAGEALAASTHGPDEPAWSYWVDAEELRIMEARVYTELHRPLRAVPLLADVLSRYDTTHARETALYLSWLAVALVDANEPEEAAAAATRMLRLSDGLPSSRTAQRATVVLDRLRPFRALPQIRDLIDSYAPDAGSSRGTVP